MINNISPKNKKRLLQFARSASTLGIHLILDSHYLTPLNFEEEKTKFFESKTSSPQYIYRKNDLSGTKEKLSQLHIRLNLLDIPIDLRNYLNNYLRNLHNLLETHLAIGTNEFAVHARRVFNWDIEEIKNIKKSLPKNKAHTSNQKPQNAEFIKKELLAALKNKYGITDYPVVINTISKHIIVDGEKQLYIGSSVKRNQNNIKRLIVHELESHVLQKRNIRESHNPLLKLITYKDRMLYVEGLAVFNEFETNTITKSAYDIYRARLEAVEYSHQSFRQIYDKLKKDISEDKAFLTAYRVKRGLGNTAHPGGLPKDAAYLEGFVLINKMKKDGEDIEKLYLYRVPKLGKLLMKYNLLETDDFLLPKF